MTVCSFFLQGRCRYGEKCWNEHPRGGGRGGGAGVGGGDYSRGTPQSNRGGGGFGNRVWVNPQRAGGDFVKPTNFGGRDVSTQNRFSTLSTPSSFDRGGLKDENDKHLETIQKDMESWESSGQWLFSCYSVLKGSVSGFVELSPEELRLEYYNGRASGDLQAYGSSVQQLASQWRNRLQELKAMNANTRSSLIAELNNPGQVPSSFGSAPSDFGSSAGFGSTAPPSGFGSTAPSGFGAAPSGFGSAPASGFGSAGFGAPAQSSATFSFAPTQSAAPTGFGSAQPPPQSGFGSAPGAAPSASSFSFAAPAAAAATKDASSGFGASAAGFSFASTAPSSGFGGGFGASTGAGGFGQSSFGGTNSGLFASAGASTAASAGASAAGLFTPQSELTADELKEFTGKRFTLGQIPLRPPPVDMLVV